MPQENQSAQPEGLTPVQAQPSKNQAYKIESEGNGTSGNGEPKMQLLSKLLAKSELSSGISQSIPSSADNSGNVFTKLFGAKSSTPPAVVPPLSSISKLLGPKPLFVQKAYAEAEAKKTRRARAIFRITFVIAIVTIGFFQSQLNPKFTLLTDQIGPNVRINFDRSNQELESLQTDINLVRYKNLRVFLDEVNADIDPFLRNTAIAKSALSTPSEKRDAQGELQIRGAKIKRTLKEVQTLLAKPLGTDTYSLIPIKPEERDKHFETFLINLINQEKDVLAKQEKPDLEQLRIFDNIRRLVENRQFRDTVLMQDLAKVSEDEFAGMLEKIREQATDELSSIAKIRAKRPNWTRVIQQIHEVALKADELYGKGFFKVQGGLLFSSYRFDAQTRRISITGLTKQSDSKVFSVIADLVENIDRSPYFKDIDFRSFSKTRDEGGNFSSSINLEFSIEKDPQDTSIELNSLPQTVPIVNKPT